MSDFQLVTRFKPAGDQPEAIRQMVEGLEAGLTHQHMADLLAFITSLK